MSCGDGVFIFSLKSGLCGYPWFAGGWWCGV